jgi:hypothetical protein
MKPDFETPYAITLDPREIEDVEHHYRWSSWQHRQWPLDILAPRLRIYGFNLRSRRLEVLLEVTRCTSFSYRSAAEFVRKVERGTRWPPDIRDPHYPLKIPKSGAVFHGLALRWKLVKRVDIPLPGRFPRLGWAPDVARLWDPQRKRYTAQGFLKSAADRQQLNLHAMLRAKAFFRRRRYSIRDVSNTQPFDLRCTRGRETILVEVKGTQSRGLKIVLTNNEVEFARRNKPAMALFVVTSITLAPTPAGGRATGGVDRLIRPWDIDEGHLRPIQFMYTIAG